jgi:hypothetical protein
MQVWVQRVVGMFRSGSRSDQVPVGMFSSRLCSQLQPIVALEKKEAILLPQLLVLGQKLQRCMVLVTQAQGNGRSGKQIEKLARIKRSDEGTRQQVRRTLTRRLVCSLPPSSMAFLPPSSDLPHGSWSGFNPRRPRRSQPYLRDHAGRGGSVLCLCPLCRVGHRWSLVKDGPGPGVGRPN